jgi:hypothetical protein
MLCFKKENGFPTDLTFDTTEVNEEDFKGFHSRVLDGKGNVIKEFDHAAMRSRIQWADGYFTALRSDYIQFGTAEKLLQRIEKKKTALEELKESHKSQWDVYGSELCAGGMLAEEEKLQNEINQDTEKFLNTLPEWLREYSGAQL